ncbi:MAG TPA: hypothetical protein VGB00_03190, partial [Pyrinomonadaceae bacterium]
LDIEQFNDSKVKAILAKYGWFQTVRNDAPHFTYLGVKESDLPERGLKQISEQGMRVWIISPRLLAGVKNKKEPEGKTKSPSGVNLTTLVLPAPNIPATVNKDVILPVALEPLLSTLTRRYHQRMGKMLHITSGYRSPKEQAAAMHFNLEKYGITYVANTYGGRPEVWEVISAFQQNREDKKKAIYLMTKILQAQVRRKKIISRHMLERAFDIRSRGKEAASLAVLREIVQAMRGKVVVEKDHYHVEFR